MRRVVTAAFFIFAVISILPSAEARSPWGASDIECRYVRTGWSVRRICKAKHRRSRRWVRANRRWQRTPYQYGVMVIPRATEPAPAATADEFPAPIALPRADLELPQPDLEIPQPDLQLSESDDATYGDAFDDRDDDWQKAPQKVERKVEAQREAPKPVVVAPEPASEPERIAPLEAQVVTLLNAKRVAVGLKPLAVDAKANAVALAHSKDMCEQRFFDHKNLAGDQPWDRMRKVGMRFSGAAENIAVGYTTAQSVHVGWLTSPDHRKNRLNSTYTRIGVGVYQCGSVPYWTEVFAK